MFRINPVEFISSVTTYIKTINMAVTDQSKHLTTFPPFVGIDRSIFFLESRP